MAVAAWLSAGCEDAVLIGEDAGVTDAGQGIDDAGLGDAGVSDAGVVDAGFVDEDKCDGSLEASPWPCEDDADFCDPLGDHESKRDFVAGWSHETEDDFVFDLRMAAPPFIRGPTFELDICVTLDSEEQDVSGACIGSRAYDVNEHVFRTVPRSAGEVLHQSPNEIIEFDPCLTVFLSIDWRTLRVVVPRFSGAMTYQPVIGDLPDIETVDDLPAEGLVSRGGTQDDTTFISVCEAQCPVEEE